jgi:hypothetical protein
MLEGLHGRGGLTFHKEEAKTHNSCSMISKAPQILKWLLFCKSVQTQDTHNLNTWNQLEIQSQQTFSRL